MRYKIQYMVCIGIIICCVSSCVFAGKDILYGQPKGFVNDYSEKLNNIDQMIKVDGYYQSDRVSHDRIYMLYRDGAIYAGKTFLCNLNSYSTQLGIQKMSVLNRWGELSNM